MKTIVITGSTRGIGLGMAHEFLARGHQVVISGRTDASVNTALQQLALKHDKSHFHGQACDVSVYEQVQALWDSAVARFGQVDIWINNAGMNNPMRSFWEQDPHMIQTVVNTNLIGTMYGSKVAVFGMQAQGFGHLYNMEGLGSKGEVQVGLALYGSSKYGEHYLTKVLVKETKNSPVKVSWLSPGIVITDLLTNGYAGREQEFERAKKIFNILADTVETVTPYLVEKILANDQHGAYIAWLTTPKIIWRFLTAKFKKRDLFAEPSSSQELTSKA